MGNGRSGTRLKDKHVFEVWLADGIGPGHVPQISPEASMPLIPNFQLNCFVGLCSFLQIAVGSHCWYEEHLTPVHCP